MQPRTSARLAGRIRSTSRYDPRSQEIAVDDVIGALKDLFDKLKIDASQIASRVKSLEHESLTSNHYSHTAAIGEILSAWHQDPRYLDKSGYPLPIKMGG